MDGGMVGGMKISRWLIDEGEERMYRSEGRMVRWKVDRYIGIWMEERVGREKGEWMEELMEKIVIWMNE